MQGRMHKFMDTNDLILMGDLKYIVSAQYINWISLKDSCVLITGATGLIGKTIVKALVEADKIYDLNITIVLLIRNEDKAKKIFAGLLLHKNFKILIGSLESIPKLNFKIDYVIHAASPTDSGHFINCPVETIDLAVNGMHKLMEEIRRGQSIKKFVFLSTMEVYGTPQDDYLITERTASNLDTMNPRNSYPEAKRLCECLGSSYYTEYGIPFAVARLTQTFGPGVNRDDGRVFAEFARCVLDNRDIELKTKGESKRSYLYTADAVTAILAILLCDEVGEVYNVANEETYCSIYEMAQLVANKVVNGKISVKITEGHDISKYMDKHCMNLSAEKLRRLGWSARFGLVDMYKRMISCMS